ncbi:MAG: hypothetical protein QG567_1299 [Campylobacterota bacterium]|nr:hypothetical protein [Campylobacterota bacterium]
MPTTIENLKVAFAGESQAFQKYEAFAKAAEKEGFKNIARLFRTTAQAEKIHAEGHLSALEGIGSTLENLKVAISGETHEFEDMYPPMLDQAQKEGHKAKKMFRFAVEAEKVHAELYELALKAVQDGKDLSETNFYLCPICGHVEMGEPTEACPICGVPASKYIQI